jgi:hypothetical protein
LLVSNLENFLGKFNGILVIYTTLSYKRILRTELVYTNYLASSLNIFIDKTLVSNSSALFTYLSIDRKLYYNSSLFLNKSIDLTSIRL